MSDLPLPMWIVRQENARALCAEDPGQTSHVMAFTAAQRFTAYMQARKAGEWSVQLVSDGQGLLLLIADLHFDSIPGLCVDPDKDGKGGSVLSLGELAIQHGRQAAR